MQIKPSASKMKQLEIPHLGEDKEVACLGERAHGSRPAAVAQQPYLAKIGSLLQHSHHQPMHLYLRTLRIF